MSDKEKLVRQRLIVIPSSGKTMDIVQVKHTLTAQPKNKFVKIDTEYLVEIFEILWFF